MGLDMYLQLKVAVTNYDFTPAGKELATAVLAALKLPNAAPFANGTLFITLPVGYWRKANAIHRWFVENVQDDVDNCQESHVSDEHLIELRELCKGVLLVPGMADEKLPAGEGFFFGSTDTGDEWYLQYLRDTVNIIDKALALNETIKGDFYYRASW